MRFVKLRLADAPVLTKAPAEIATGGAKAQHAGSGQEMIQRFFFDGIDGEAGGCAVAERIEFAVDVLADVAEAALALAQATETRTEGAEDLPIVFCLAPESFFHRQTIPLFRMSGKWLRYGATFAAWCDILRSMGRVSGLKGMRHIALKVRNVARSKSFYQDILGMEVVWEPDPQNVYLSSGCDNIALHEVSRNFATGATEQQLDHLGFVVATIDQVKQLEETFRASGVKIVHPFKVHRDGSASFYCADPDGIVIQMLYEPHLSSQEID